MSSRRDRISLRKLVLTIWLATLTLAISQPGRAEVRVSGNADALIVETREASADEVLAALRTSFNIQYHTSGAAIRVVTGSYTGSLRQVLARLFNGQNYVIRSSTNGIEIAVFGPAASSSRAIVWGRQQPAVAKAPDFISAGPVVVRRGRLERHSRPWAPQSTGRVPCKSENWDSPWRVTAGTKFRDNADQSCRNASRWIAAASPDAPSWQPQRRRLERLNPRRDVFACTQSDGRAAADSEPRYS